MQGKGLGTLAPILGSASSAIMCIGFYWCTCSHVMVHKTKKILQCLQTCERLGSGNENSESMEENHVSKLLLPLPLPLPGMLSAFGGIFLYWDVAIVTELSTDF